jgi:4-alpha-glucanotransferase
MDDGGIPGAPKVNGEAVRARAREAGLAVEWVDAQGRLQRVRAESLRRLIEALDGAKHRPVMPRLVTARLGSRIELPLDGDRPAELLLEDGEIQSVAIRGGRLAAIGKPGYHTLRLADCEVTIAVAPARCVTLEEACDGRRMWGIAAQVYSLRRAGDGGIGDFESVRELAEAAARQGADALAISPVHSLFTADPKRCSPYSPSNRLFLNPLYASPSATFDAGRVASCRQPGEEDLERARMIDWPRAAAAKIALLETLFDDFKARDLGANSGLAVDFERFVREGGEDLRRHAQFEAQHGHSVAFHLFLQWLTARSLADAQRRARAAGMRIGLISDLAVGMDPAGSHAWARRGDLLEGLSIGAPPDAFNPLGQDWGLTGFSPHALVAMGFAPFLATLRAALRHAGGVRIDHVMGLMRLWLVPRGLPPTEGTYLAYPFDDLLRLLALESHRHRAVVVGEDLGTVPRGLRSKLRRVGIAGSDVLWFERTRLSFKRPARWRPDALATTTTHDLPTVAGWWSGTDIRTRRALSRAGVGEEEERARDRRQLWRALVGAGAATGEMPPVDQPAGVVDAALGYVAQSPARLMLAPVEDLLALREQANLPGTIDEHPNWQRRLAPATCQLFEDPAVRARARIIGDRRR